MPIRLMENFRAIFYAPYYATHALGFYQREGVEVELKTSDVPGDAVPKLIDGSVDITWGGPMRVMKAHDQDKELAAGELLRGGIARSVLPDRSARRKAIPAHRSRGQEICLGVRGADALDVPAAGSARPGH